MKFDVEIENQPSNIKIYSLPRQEKFLSLFHVMNFCSFSAGVFFQLFIPHYNETCAEKD
jgi:hypothetical protein